MDDKLKAKDLNARLAYAFGNEIEYLQELAKTLPVGAMCVQLGAGPGIMSLALLEANPKIALFSVDLDLAVIDTHVKHLAAGGFKANVSYQDTVEFSSNFADQSVDFLLVDANHSYDGVLRDIKAWWSKVKPNGIVFFHDYIDVELNGTNGVARAIGHAEGSGIIEKFEEVSRPGISLVYRKLG